MYLLCYGDGTRVYLALPGSSEISMVFAPFIIFSLCVVSAIIVFFVLRSYLHQPLIIYQYPTQKPILVIIYKYPTQKPWRNYSEKVKNKAKVFGWGLLKSGKTLRYQRPQSPILRVPVPCSGRVFQEALVGSVIIPQQKTENNKKNMNRVMVLRMTPIKPTLFVKGGVDASESSQGFCEICMERKDRDQMFRMEKCVHSYCSDCISKYVETKIHDNSIKNVTCPGLDCKAALDMDTCRSMLPKRVIDRWEDALCQELIGALQSFYCPFKDCSAMLVNESDAGEIIKEAECPFCHRLFCAQCHVPWHSGVDCEQFQRLNEDERGKEDIMVMQLAKNSKWARCPSCKYYVERTQGCPHMTCRCKYQFCYGCGSQWTPNHGGCSRN